jgi:hypothetical protein
VIAQPEQIVAALTVIANHKMPDENPITEDQAILVQYVSMVKQVAIDAAEYIGLLQKEIELLKQSKNKRRKKAQTSM